MAKMPYYYVMALNASMPQAVALSMADEDPKEVSEKSVRWLDDKELGVYVQEFGRNGFQGGLNWYRRSTNPQGVLDVELFAGRKIDVPSLFISGKQDWGTYQEPGVVQKMSEVCSKFKGAESIDGAGHWAQQEQPGKVIELVTKCLKEIKTDAASY